MDEDSESIEVSESTEDPLAEIFVESLDELSLLTVLFTTTHDAATKYYHSAATIVVLRKPPAARPAP